MIDHHSDPVINLGIEVERLEGLLYEAHMGLFFQAGGSKPPSLDGTWL